MELKSLKNSKLKLIIINFFIFSFSLAQDNVEKLLRSPESYNFNKNYDFKTELSRGTLSIDIPLLDISCNDISTNLYLSYNSSGIKIEEEASTIGLGWSLHGIGQISREIRNKPDEIGILNNSNIYNQLIYPQNCNDYQLISAYSLHSSGSESVDLEPDLFRYNMNGYSGVFYLNHLENNIYNPIQGKVIKELDDNVKISYEIENNKISKFILIDPKGYQYYFGKNKNNTKERIETSETTLYSVSTNNGVFNLNNSDSDSGGNTTWYLLEVISPQNNVVKYDYELVSFEQKILRKSNQSVTIGVNGNPNFNNSLINYSSSNYTSYGLKSIETDNAIVEFKYSNSFNRIDINNSKKLESIILKDKLKNTQVLKYVFVQNYLTCDEETINQAFNFLENSYSFFYNARRNRLMLNEILKYGSSDEYEMTKFTYNSTKLPDKFSNAVDIFGYYNGKINNKTAIPKGFIFFGDESPRIVPSDDFSGDRTVDPLFTNALMLEAIDYPSGAKSVFEYENHKLLSLEDSINYQQQNGTYNTNFDIYYNKLEQTSINFNNYSNPSETYFEFEFQINSKFKTIHFDINSTGFNDLGNLSQGYMIFIVDKQTNGQNYYKPISVQSGSFFMNDGTYKLIAQKILESNETFSINLNWFNETNPDYYIASGLRIKSVVIKDQNIAVTKKQYIYQEGVNNYRPAFISFVDPQAQSPGQINPRINSKNVFNSSLDYSIYYLNVREIVNDIFITDHEYSFKGRLANNKSLTPGANLSNFSGSSCGITNIGTTLDNSPYVPEIFTGYARGKLINKTSYKIVNNSLYRVQKEEFEYDSLVNYIKVFGMMTSSGVNHTYGMNSVVHRLKQKKIIDYFTNDELVLNQVFSYGSINNTLPISIKHTNNSDLSMKNEVFYYTFDSLSSLNQTLVNRNIIEQPIKTESFKNGEKLSTQETIYKNWGNNLLAPEIIRTAKGNQSLEDKLKYNVMDNTNGNPLEIQQESGIKIVYIWGYNKTQPIAKIENATYASIPSSTITNLQNLSNTGTEANLITALNALRVSLPNAMVTTYSHKPLIGISTITDPKGDTQTYHYDSFNRLQFVKDAQGNILSENQYHYKN